VRGDGDNYQCLLTEYLFSRVSCPVYNITLHSHVRCTITGLSIVREVLQHVVNNKFPPISLDCSGSVAQQSGRTKNIADEGTPRHQKQMMDTAHSEDHPSNPFLMYRCYIGSWEGDAKCNIDSIVELMILLPCIALLSHPWISLSLPIDYTSMMLRGGDMNHFYDA
jgi:hypothetical protein